MNCSGNFREGLAREIRENKTLAKITAYTVLTWYFCIAQILDIIRYIYKQLGSTKTKQASYVLQYITHLHQHTWLIHNSYMSKMCIQNIANIAEFCAKFAKINVPRIFPLLQYMSVSNIFCVRSQHACPFWFDLKYELPMYTHILFRILFFIFVMGQKLFYARHTHKTMYVNYILLLYLKIWIKYKFTTFSIYVCKCWEVFPMLWQAVWFIY